MPQLNDPESDFATQFNGVKMDRMKKTGDEKPMEDALLDLPAIAMLRHLQAGRNKNLNRGFRKLAPVKCVSPLLNALCCHFVNLTW